MSALSLQENYEKKNWKVRPLVDESFVPSAQRTRELYCRLSDLRSNWVYALLTWITQWAIYHHCPPCLPSSYPHATIYIVLVGGNSWSNWGISNCQPCPPSSYTPGTIYIVLVGGTSWSKWVCALLIWLMFFILPSSPPFYQASFTSLLLKDWGSLVEFKINAQSNFTLLR